MQTAPSALALIMRFTYSQAANTLKRGNYSYSCLLEKSQNPPLYKKGSKLDPNNYRMLAAGLCIDSTPTFKEI
jgi:hypothetical protein